MEDKMDYFEKQKLRKKQLSQLKRDIKRLTDKLIRKADRDGLCEDFGEKEERYLKEKYDYFSLQYSVEDIEKQMARMIDDFIEWRLCFDLSQLRMWRGYGNRS